MTHFLSPFLEIFLEKVLNLVKLLVLSFCKLVDARYLSYIPFMSLFTFGIDDVELGFSEFTELGAGFLEGFLVKMLGCRMTLTGNVCE